MIDNSKEYIICAAIYVKDKQRHTGQPKNIDTGFVVTGRRHSNCYSTIKAIVGDDIERKNEIMGYDSNNNNVEEYNNCQGFLTSLDRYVNRKEGWTIALNNNQIRWAELIKESELISENLY